MLRRLVGLLIRLGVTTAGLALATAVYPHGLQLPDPSRLLSTGLALGFVHAVVRPVILLLTLPLNLLTLGVFTVVVNTFLLYLVAWLLGLPHGGFWDLLVLSVLVSIASLSVAKLVGT